VTWHEKKITHDGLSLKGAKDEQHLHEGNLTNSL
jgi:hypothetical protein